MDLATLNGSAIGSSSTNGMLASSLAFPTSFQTASLKSALGKCFLSAEGRDSRFT